MYKRETCGLLALKMGRLSVFSASRRDEGDFRDARNQHNIKIIRVEANGDVDFVLYGYMNRGFERRL